MHDLPSQMLLQQSAARRVSGQDLEMFGKQAASSYLSGCSDNLSSAVVETVKQAGLSPEQVKRVVEFANQTAYLKEFAKESAAHKYVQFQGGPANPAEVLRDLNDGGGGTVFDPGTGDYNQPPPPTAKVASIQQGNRRALGLEKVASVPMGAAERAFEEMWQVEDHSLPYADPWSDAVEMRDKLASAADLLRTELHTAEATFEDVCEDMFQQVKQASLSGVPLGHVVQAWGEVVPGPDYVKLAFSVFADRLVREQVLSLGELTDSLEKQASAGSIANEEHPLVGVFSAFCTQLDKMAHARAARDEVLEAYGQVQTFLKRASAAKLVGAGLGKAWQGAKKGGEIAGKVGKEVLEGANMPGAARAVEMGGKALPYLGAGIAGKEVYDRGVKYGPLGHVTDYAAAQIPGTRQNQQRQMQLAMQAQSFGRGMY